jgi:hypothetical protein
MLMTRDQQKLFDVIRHTGYLTAIHARRLLDKSVPVGSTGPVERAVHSGYPLRVLGQLQYLQKIRLNRGDVACLPHLVDSPVDHDMLSAIDVMLDLSGNAPVAVSSRKPPFKLCFLSQCGDRLGSYGIVAAPSGDERRVCLMLDEYAKDGAGNDLDSRTVVFVLRDPGLREAFNTSLPHYFAVFDAGKYRYFKGA